MKEKKIMKSVRLDKSMMKKLEQRAKRENRSFNNLINTIFYEQREAKGERAD